MRVVFAGTPPFAATALEAVARAGHSIPLVLTQPDRPSGRGMRTAASAVAAAAEQMGLAVAKPATLRDEAVRAELRRVAPEVLVVAAYGLILPQAVLEIPARGCLNIHASLLPRWRGAAPIQRALLAGDARTGISIMQMDAGLDTGPVLLEKPIAIDARDTAGTLTEKLARLGAESIVEALEQLPALVPVPQDSTRSTYAPKVEKAEATIDWSRPADEIERQVRAFNPVPGAEALIAGQRLKVWEAEAVAGTGTAPGTVGHSSKELVVECGTGALRVLVVQRAGGRRVAAPDFLRGHPWLDTTGSGVTH